MRKLDAAGASVSRRVRLLRSPAWPDSEQAKQGWRTNTDRPSMTKNRRLWNQCRRRLHGACQGWSRRPVTNVRTLLAPITAQWWPMRASVPAGSLITARRGPIRRAATARLGLPVRQPCARRDRLVQHRIDQEPRRGSRRMVSTSDERCPPAWTYPPRVSSMA